MLFKGNKKPLPRKLMDGVAPKILTSNIQLFRFPTFSLAGKLGLKKPLNRYSKLAGLTILGLYLLGYQPVMAFPPIQKVTVQAQENELEQKVDSVALPQPFSLPHPAYITTRFSNWHPGIDLCTGLGMPIHPINEGVVTEIELGLWGYGHFVVVTHPQGYTSKYAHMGRVFAKVGDPVTPGSIIGEVGMTGRTSGPHTHLEVTKDGKFINPLTILPAVETMPKPEYLTSYQKPAGGPNYPVPAHSATKVETPKVEAPKELPKPSLPTFTAPTSSAPSLVPNFSVKL